MNINILNRIEISRKRIIDSWYDANIKLNKRIISNTQPDLPGADIITMISCNMIYLIICFLLYIIMKKRKKGFQVNWLILLYNGISVFLAAYIVVGILLFKLEIPGTFACNPLTTSKRGQQLAFVFWVFYIQKFWEFLDTWLFLLRKSNRQVTFLHLFHHTSITLIVGTIIKYDFSGDMYLPVLLNSLVHVLVYMHYLLLACGIQSWWRPYLTSIQIIQFFCIGGQSLLAWQYGKTCGSPDFAKFLLILYMCSMAYLFASFFVRRYIFHTNTTSISGVIKSIPLSLNDAFSGNIILNNSGAGKVVLSHYIVKQKDIIQREYHYQLTAIESAMPNLHIGTELYSGDDDKATFIISGGIPKGYVSWQLRIISYKNIESIDKLHSESFDINDKIK